MINVDNLTYLEDDMWKLREVRVTLFERVFGRKRRRENEIKGFERSGRGKRKGNSG